MLGAGVRREKQITNVRGNKEVSLRATLGACGGVGGG